MNDFGIYESNLSDGSLSDSTVSEIELCFHRASPSY